MSTIDSEDLGATGEAWPMHSLQRLAKLRVDVALLAQLARTRGTDAPPDDLTAVRLSEMARSLTWLEARIGQVLDVHSSATEADERTAAQDADAVPDDAAYDDAASAMDDAGPRYMSGITLDQIDAIHELLDKLRAHGDVVTCSHRAEFADGTLTMMGDAIYRDAGTLRDLIDAIDAQRLTPPRSTRPGVAEEGATYLGQPWQVPMDSASHLVREHPTYQ
ncbi:XAC0095 family protein [Dyella lutea]|uniref:XAC0095-like domain-containing protein n=1 Tax=Dyella lutea TaxID=2950441 RepID=A0ABT1FD50_9GAMM|nr:hypothetical protein [Dyella lutea]MCP1375301.1 hypothetical protein [Dyella lutea]